MIKTHRSFLKTPAAWLSFSIPNQVMAMKSSIFDSQRTATTHSYFHFRKNMKWLKKLNCASFQIK